MKKDIYIEKSKAYKTFILFYFFIMIVLNIVAFFLISNLLLIFYLNILVFISVLIIGYIGACMFSHFYSFSITDCEFCRYFMGNEEKLNFEEIKRIRQGIIFNSLITQTFWGKKFDIPANWLIANYEDFHEAISASGNKELIKLLKSHGAKPSTELKHPTAK